MKFTVSIEGVDNVGKTSVCTDLVLQLIGMGYEARIEPEFGDDFLGIQTRFVVENHWASIPVLAQPLLIAADRIHRYRSLMEDNSSSLEVIIFDRHLFSTEVYQSIAWEMPINEMRKYLKRIYDDTYVYPDLTFILDAPIETVIERGGDDIHSVRYLKLARESYLGYKTMSSVRIVDATQPFGQVIACCMNIVREELKNLQIPR